ncbi:MAG: general secretion pathway protein B [Lysobacterales bacterium]|jgi:general secretion pathway protein B
MSFLLDALRKSENQKRLGNAPSIHSTTDPGRTTHKRFNPALLILILLPALLVVSWYGWQVFLDTNQVVSETVKPKETFSSSREEEGRPSKINNLPAIPQQLPSGGTVNSERTPVETYQPQTSPVEARQAISAPQEASPETIMIQELSKTIEPEILEVETSQVPDSGSSTPRLEAISYWQLPEAIRQELPELRISVLVYAEKPDDRFILLNGRRLVEGDEVQSGMLLMEIRRLGVIFRYRHYQFMVSR